MGVPRSSDETAELASTAGVASEPDDDEDGDDDDDVDGTKTVKDCGSETRWDPASISLTCGGTCDDRIASYWVSAAFVGRKKRLIPL
eukprot:1765503-Rhodomonas_salina.1